MLRSFTRFELLTSLPCRCSSNTIRHLEEAVLGKNKQSKASRRQRELFIERSENQRTMHRVFVGRRLVFVSVAPLHSALLPIKEWFVIDRRFASFVSTQRSSSDGKRGPTR